MTSRFVVVSLVAVLLVQCASAELLRASLKADNNSTVDATSSTNGTDTSAGTNSTAPAASESHDSAPEESHAETEGEAASEGAISVAPDGELVVPGEAAADPREQTADAVRNCFANPTANPSYYVPPSNGVKFDPMPRAITLPDAYNTVDVINDMICPHFSLNKSFQGGWAKNWTLKDGKKTPFIYFRSYSQMACLCTACGGHAMAKVTNIPSGQHFPAGLTHREFTCATDGQ